MADFEYSHLCLVRPKEGLIKIAKPYSAKGAPVLRASKVFPGLGHAILDADLRVGTSAKLSGRAGVTEFMSPREIASHHLRFSKPVLVFGREPSGFTNEDLSMMDLNTKIPTHPDYPTLNLAISVAIILYELRMAPAPPARDYELATVNQIDGVVRAYSHTLDAFGFPTKKIDASGRALLSLMKKSNSQFKGDRAFGL